VSFNEPLVVRSDIRHSQREKRYFALWADESWPVLICRFHHPA
jgi:hypothetical protein